MFAENKFPQKKDLFKKMLFKKCCSSKMCTKKWQIKDDQKNWSKNKIGSKTLIGQKEYYFYFLNQPILF